MNHLLQGDYEIITKADTTIEISKLMWWTVGHIIQAI